MLGGVGAIFNLCCVNCAVICVWMIWVICVGVAGGEWGDDGKMRDVCYVHALFGQLVVWRWWRLLRYWQNKQAGWGGCKVWTIISLGGVVNECRMCIVSFWLCVFVLVSWILLPWCGVPSSVTVCEAVKMLPRDRGNRTINSHLLVGDAPYLCISSTKNFVLV